MRLLLPLLLTACTTPMPDTPTLSLAGSEWGPTDTATFGPDTFLQFREDTLSASAGCNQLSATYTLDGARLALSPIRSTRMMCPPPVMAHETALTTALQSTRSAHTSRDGANDGARTELVLHDDTGTPILRLRRRDWD